MIFGRGPGRRENNEPASQLGSECEGEREPTLLRSPSAASATAKGNTIATSDTLALTSAIAAVTSAATSTVTNASAARTSGHHAHNLGKDLGRGGRYYPSTTAFAMSEAAATRRRGSSLGHDLASHGCSLGHDLVSRGRSLGRDFVHRGHSLGHGLIRR